MRRFIRLAFWETNKKRGKVRKKSKDFGYPEVKKARNDERFKGGVDFREEINEKLRWGVGGGGCWVGGFQTNERKNGDSQEKEGNAEGKVLPYSSWCQSSIARLFPSTKKEIKMSIFLDDIREKEKGPKEEGKGKPN